MNEKAKELKMFDTHFENATGFDHDNLYTSSYDMCLLGSHLVGYGEKILKYSSMKEGYIREESESPFWLVNTNKLLNHYEGMDGLKTGYTSKAGYNLTSTAYRNGVRLVSTVMNLDTIAHRSQDTIRLLDYGFSKLKAISLFDRDEIVTTFKIDESMNQYLHVACKDDVKIIIDKSESENDIKINARLTKLSSPYKKGEKVGVLEIETKSNKKYTYDLYALNDVEKNNFFHYLFKFLRLMFL